MVSAIAKTIRGPRPNGLITLFSLILLSNLVIGAHGNRKVSAELNPGCTSHECANITLVHVKAKGENDTLHHLWDFTGKPSLLLALTDNNANISISWTAFSLGKDNSVTFHPAPQYVFSVVVDKLIEFNDTNDTGALVEHQNSTIMYDTENFEWTVLTLANFNSDAAILTIEAPSNFATDNQWAKNGTIRIVVSAYGGEDHTPALPHMLHSGNASQMDITINRMDTQHPNSRFGLHLVTLSSYDSTNNTLTVQSRKTMDDQPAPGVFTMVELRSPGEECGGYLQWRPVVYLTPTREMTSSTESVQYLAVPPQDPIKALNNTLPYSLLGNQLAGMLVTATNVTFGVRGDGFYRKTKYAAWTVVMGYGHPPVEQFSTLVTFVLLLGLGLPAILVIVGTICIVCQRVQRNKNDLYLG